MFHCNGWCFPWTVRRSPAHTSACAGSSPQMIFARSGVSRHPFLRRARGANMLSMPRKRSGCAARPGRHADCGRRTASDGAGRDGSGWGLKSSTFTGSPRPMARWRFRNGTRNGNPRQLAARARLKARQGVRAWPRRGLDVFDLYGRYAGAARRRDGRRDRVARQYRDEGLSQESRGQREAFRSGWFHTGDLGVMHPDGYLEVTDRAKDIVYLRGREYLEPRDRGRPVQPSRRARSGGGRAPRSEVGRDAVRVRRTQAGRRRERR